jgi:peptide/nickel transport system ATP-binding protein
MDELILVSHLAMIFGRRNPTYALDDVSMAVPSQPGFISLVGESGSGKTTMARVMLGLLKPTAGGVFYNGTSIATADSAWQKRFRREVQVVFQDPYSVYNPAYKVDRVLMKPIRKFNLAGNSQEAAAMIDEALRTVELRPDDVLGKFPHQLSGGQRQRVMLARICLIQPRLIVADEAISMIDAAGRVGFLNILLDFRDELGISTLFITHDLSTAQYLGGGMIVLYRGRIVEQGDARRVTTKPLHPYTQLLVQSIPTPDPHLRWTEHLSDSGEISTYSTPNRNRCLFAERCPEVMDVCWKARPVLKQPSDLAHEREGGVACHLY